MHFTFPYGSSFKIPLAVLTVASLSSLFLILSFFSGQAFASSKSSTLQSGDPEVYLTPITVQLNWSHQFQFAGFYAAIQQGYYRDAGLEVQLAPWRPGVDMIDEVVSKRADFGVGYSSIIVDYAKGAPIKLVMASFQFSPMVLLSHEPVTELSQMSGKSVMHVNNLQIKTLIAKASEVIDEPMTEVVASGNLQDFIDRKVDLYGSYYTNEPYRLKQMGIPFFILDPKAYGIQSYGDLIFTHQKKTELAPDVVSRFREATIAGWEYAIQHQAEVVDYILLNYPVNKSRDALLSEAQATTMYVKSGKAEVGEIDARKLLSTAAYAREAGVINCVELDNIDIKQLVFDPNQSLYTSAELEYIKAHPRIKIGNNTQWAPFEYIDSQGEYQGVASDYFKLMGEMLGIEFEPVRDKSWTQVKKMFQDGEVDLLTTVPVTTQSPVGSIYTEPYLSFPIVLAAAKQLDYLDQYDRLKGQKVAVVKDSWPHESLAYFHPGVSPLLVDSVEEGLLSVINGRALGYSGSLAAINYTVKQHGLDGLKIIGQSERRFELAIGVHQDNELLHSIMEKTLARISQFERQKIYNDWIQLTLLTESSRWWYVLALTLSVLLVIAMVWVLAMHRSKKLLQSYVDTVNELSLATVTDSKGTLIWVSDSFLKLSGYQRDELIGQPAKITKSAAMSDEEYSEIYESVLKGKAWQGEVEGRHKDGSIYYVNLTAVPEFRFGKVQKITVSREDLTDRKKAEELSIRDALTGLYNRRYFSDVFAREIKRAQREEATFIFAMADVDFFKELNDGYGHLQGDKALQEISIALKGRLKRPQDLLFRLGGEEFGMILHQMDLESVEQFLSFLGAAVKALGIKNKLGVDGVVTLSFGAIVLPPDHGLSSDAIFKLADDLMYQAKESGRDKVVVKPLL